MHRTGIEKRNLHRHILHTTFNVSINSVSAFSFDANYIDIFHVIIGVFLYKHAIQFLYSTQGGPPIDSEVEPQKCDANLVDGKFCWISFVYVHRYGNRVNNCRIHEGDYNSNLGPVGWFVGIFGCEIDARGDDKHVTSKEIFRRYQIGYVFDQNEDINQHQRQ